METLSADVEVIAEALANAYTLNRPGVGSDFRAPADLLEAAAVQAEVARLLDAGVAGWKIGYMPDGTPVAAPIFDRFLKPSGAHFPLRDAAIWGVEPEIAVRLGADLPRRIVQPYHREDILCAIDSVLVGIEIVASRVIDHKAAPFLLYLADNIGHSGYAFGAEKRHWNDLDLSALRTTLTINGNIVHDAIGGHPTVDPLKPLLDYANAQSDRLGGLRAGQIITTGSLCGLVAVDEPGEVAAAVEGIGEARLYIHG
jgi:2-keto-4-pentenoate hydratase